MNYTEFAQKIKVKYPEYQEMDDLELSQKIVSKYPEYKEVVEFGQPIPTEVPESKPTETPLNESEAPKGTPADVGLAQSAFLGTSFGTAPLIAGGVDVARNLAKKVLPAKLPEFLQKQKDLVLGTDNKNIGESFKGGRERFLESQQQYAKQAPVASTLAEVGGGFALPIGSLGGVAKGLSVLDKIKKGAKAGAILGGAYGAGTGLSQTKDKILDPEMAAEGATFGGTIGLVSGGLGSAIPQGIKKLITSKDIGRKLDYIVPSGTQKKTIENIIENPKVQKEAVKKGFNMNYDIYLDDASNRIVGINDEIKKIANEAYKNVPDTIKIDLTKNNALGKMRGAIQEFETATQFLPNEQAMKESTTIVNNLSKNLKNQKIDFGDLKKLTNVLNELSQKNRTAGDYTTANMYSQMRKALVEARDEVPQIKKASSLYEDMMNAKSKLENALGVDLNNPKNVSTKILTDLRDNKGNLVNSQIEDVVGIFSKRPETKHLTDINDKIKLAQTSYDLRPKEESKLLSAIASKGKSLIQELTGTSPAEKSRNLAKRLSSGQITKEQLSEPFNLISSPMFEESVNKFVQGQEAFGGKIPSMANAVKKLQLSKYTLPRLTIMDLIKQKEETK